jgi:phosphoserine aminotransferase
MITTTPAVRPARAYFSSGPCAKGPGWQIQNLQDAPVARSHRAAVAKTRLKLAIELTRELLQVPAAYRIGIVWATTPLPLSAS